MKIYNNTIKRILSGVTGLVLAATSYSVAFADKQVTIRIDNGEELTYTVPDNTTNLVFNTEGVLVGMVDDSEMKPVTSSDVENIQERVEAPMTLDEFNMIVANVVNTLKNTPEFDLYPSYRFMNTDSYNDNDLLRDARCLVYYTNIEYIRGTELETQLFDLGYINRYDNATDDNSWVNLYSAYNLINHIADYNHRRIAKITCTNNGEIKSREIIENDENNASLENLIDLSIFCRDPHDKEVLHEQYLKLKELGYSMTNIKDVTDENSRNNLLTSLDNCFNLLTTLNSDSQNSNNATISVGANWLNMIGNGTTTINWIELYLDCHYPRKELGKYFDKNYLNLNQWYIKGEFDVLMGKEGSQVEPIEYDMIDDEILARMLYCDSTLHYFDYHVGNIALMNVMNSETKTK